MAGGSVCARNPALLKALLYGSGGSGIDVRVAEVLQRLLSGERRYLWLDATIIKIRQGGICRWLDLRWFRAARDRSGDPDQD